MRSAWEWGLRQLGERPSGPHASDTQRQILKRVTEVRVGTICVCQRHGVVNAKDLESRDLLTQIDEFLAGVINCGDILAANHQATCEVAHRVSDLSKIEFFFDGLA